MTLAPPYLFLPVIHWRGWRYRTRIRLIRWRWPKRVVDEYPEGRVVRVWCGWVLVTVMRDQG